MHQGIGKPPGDHSFRLQALEVANNAGIASISRTELVPSSAEGRLAGVAFTHRHTHDYIPAFPISPWYRTHWSMRRALIVLGSDTKNPPRRVTPRG